MINFFVEWRKIALHGEVCYLQAKLYLYPKLRPGLKTIGAKLKRSGSQVTNHDLER